MALKDWKYIGAGTYTKTFIGRQKSTSVNQISGKIIDKPKNKKYSFNVDWTDHPFNRIISRKIFKNKSEALKAQKAYMRKH